jgi:hypothetical protein
MNASYRRRLDAVEAAISRRHGLGQHRPWWTDLIEQDDELRAAWLAQRGFSSEEMAREAAAGDDRKFRAHERFLGELHRARERAAARQHQKGATR